MVDMLKGEAEKLMNKINQSLPNYKAFEMIMKCSDHLTINTLEKLVEDYCTEDITKLGFILMINFYFDSGVLCEDIYRFFDICKFIGESYGILDQMKIQFFSYLSSRLENKRLTPDKLVIIRFIHEKMKDKKDLVLDVCKRRLKSFFKKYLNIPNFLDINEYYDGVLIGELILDISLTPGYEFTNQVIDFYIRLKDQIDRNLITSLSRYDRALLFLKKISQFMNFPAFTRPEIRKINADYSNVLTRLQRMASKQFDHLMHVVPTSIENLKETMKKAPMEINLEDKTCTHRGGANKTSHEMSINVYTIEGGENVILKQYALNDNQKPHRSIFLEIKANETAELIRERLGDYTCFLPYYGALINEDDCTKIILIMKNGYTTLFDKIDQNARTFKFSEAELKDNFKKLIRSFYELKKVGILHSDIKPNNLLVNNEKKVFIIDFNCCRIIDIKDREPTIRGTTGYASPELFVFLSEEARTRTFKYDSEKSDVFSLGMVFMEMALIKVVSYQNSYGELYKLYSDLDKIDYKWARDLIRNMINKDPWDRPDFEELNTSIDSFIN